MKKQVILLIFIVCILNLKLSSAALGLAPAKVEFNFKPYEIHTINYQIFSDKPNKTIDIYSEGILENYTTFDKKRVVGAATFTATITTPAEIQEPGTHRFTIGVRENTTGEGQTGFFGTAIAIEAAVFVNVPYPGKYADASISVEDINVGEPLLLSITVISRGKENITANVNVDIYTDGDKIDSIDFGSKLIESQQKKDYVKQVDSVKYGAGSYRAVATINYGGEKPATAETDFKIGSLNVEIINWTKEFIIGEINNFNVEVESKWNNDIEDVYAQLLIYNDTEMNQTIVDIKTPSEKLSRWSRQNLTTFIDASSIKKGIYNAEIKVFYENNFTGKNFKAVFKSKPKKTIYIVLGAVVLVFVIIMVIIIIKRKKKNKKQVEI